MTRARAERLVLTGDRATTLEARAMDAAGIAPTGRKLTISARTFVAAAGAIGTPALQLRSGAPDPHGLTGRRTFLHPSIVSAALMTEQIDGFAASAAPFFSVIPLDERVRLIVDGA